MSRSTAKILSVISAITVVIICLLFVPSGNQGAMTIVVLLYMPFAIWLNSKQRCPHCGRWPRKGDFWAEYCRSCGEKLDD